MKTAFAFSDMNFYFLSPFLSHSISLVSLRYIYLFGSWTWKTLINLPEKKRMKKLVNLAEGISLYYCIHRFGRAKTENMGLFVINMYENANRRGMKQNRKSINFSTRAFCQSTNSACSTHPVWHHVFHTKEILGFSVAPHWVFLFSLFSMWVWFPSSDEYEIFSETHNSIRATPFAAYTIQKHIFSLRGDSLVWCEKFSCDNFQDNAMRTKEKNRKEVSQYTTTRRRRKRTVKLRKVLLPNCWFVDSFTF